VLPCLAGASLAPVQPKPRLFMPSVARRLYDVRVDAPAEIVWRARVERGVVQRGRVDVPASGRRVIDVTLPAMRARVTLHIELQLQRDGRTLASRREAVDLFPRKLLTGGGIARPGIAPVGLYDPDGVIAPVLKRNGVAFVPLRSELEVRTLRSRILLVAPGRAEDVCEPVNAFWQAARRGATLLCLEQPRYPRWTPARGNARDAAPGRAPIERVVGDGHPLLRDLAAGDLNRWDGRGALVTGALPRLKGIRARPALRAGSGAVLWEAWPGKGRAIFCQLKVGARLQDEPAAHLLLRNLLVYARSAPTPRWVAAQGFAIPADAMARGRLDMRRFTALASEDEPAATCFIAPASAARGGLTSLSQILATGGTVALFVKPDPAAARSVNDLIRRTWRHDPRWPSPVFETVEGGAAGPVRPDYSHKLSWGIAKDDVRRARFKNRGALRARRAVDGFTEVIRPGIMLEYRRGGARLILCAVGPVPLKPEDRGRFVKQLLVNLGFVN